MFFYHYNKLTGLLAPAILSNEKIKLGRDSDSTYVLSEGIIAEETCLLSFGIDDDFSFEEDFFQHFPRADNYAFDPTIQALPATNAKMKL